MTSLADTNCLDELVGGSYHIYNSRSYFTLSDGPRKHPVLSPNVGRKVYWCDSEFLLYLLPFRLLSSAIPVFLRASGFITFILSFIIIPSQVWESRFMWADIPGPLSIPSLLSLFQVLNWGLRVGLAYPTRPGYICDCHGIQPSLHRSSLLLVLCCDGSPSIIVGRVSIRKLIFLIFEYANYTSFP